MSIISWRDYDLIAGFMQSGRLISGAAMVKIRPDHFSLRGYYLLTGAERHGHVPSGFMIIRSFL
jgi:hypothetical protein